MDSDKSSSDSKSTGIRPAVAIFCRSVLTEIFGYLPVETSVFRKAGNDNKFQILFTLNDGIEFVFIFEYFNQEFLSTVLAVECHCFSELKEQQL